MSVAVICGVVCAGGRVAVWLTLSFLLFGALRLLALLFLRLPFEGTLRTSVFRVLLSLLVFGPVVSPWRFPSPTVCARICCACSFSVVSCA